FRKASDEEIAALLAAFWIDGPARVAAHARLEGHLARIDALPGDALPFDESREDEIFPRLVDVGWELLPLAALDAERHKGAIHSFDDFEVARFEEENAVPPIVTLCELPLLGATELLCDPSSAPFVVWTEGHESYVDYV